VGTLRQAQCAFGLIDADASLPLLPPLRCLAILAGLFRGARSSAVEHHLDMVGVTGSIPVARTTLSLAPPFLSVGKKKVDKVRVREERTRIERR
jgi:hypothetical protein